MQLWIRMPSSAEFQSTLSVGRATHALQGIRENLEYFNPHPPWGERPPPEFVLLVFIVFQSTPSARRATLILFVLRAVTLFQSTPSARRATVELPEPLLLIFDFNPRPPRGERRWHRPCREAACLFQSTPSARRATCPLRQSPDEPAISIHALREESDRRFVSTLPSGCRFQSTPSARRATCCRPPARGLLPISIHALREESDRMLWPTELKRHKFQSTPSARRATETDTIYTERTEVFQSTPSARRATAAGAVGWRTSCQISIHALREESDLVVVVDQVGFFGISIHALREESDDIRILTPQIFALNFNPRPPRGERRNPGSPQHWFYLISIHALREESDTFTSGGV